MPEPLLCGFLTIGRSLYDKKPLRTAEIAAFNRTWVKTGLVTIDDEAGACCLNIGPTNLW